jgi:hypothetical protein
MRAERTRSNDKRLPDANGCKGKRRLVREDVPGVRGLVAGENLRGLGKGGGKKRSRGRTVNRVGERWELEAVTRLIHDTLHMAQN